MRNTHTKLRYKKECGQWHAIGILWQEYSGKASWGDVERKGGLGY